MALSQSLGIVGLLTVMSSNRARYGFMASPPSYRISPGTPSGPNDLFLLIAGSRFLIIFMSVVKGSLECVEFYLRDVSLAAEYRSIIGIKEVGLTIESEMSAVTVLNCRNMFHISFTSFYILVELCPAFTFVL